MAKKIPVQKYDFSELESNDDESKHFDQDRNETQEFDNVSGLSHIKGQDRHFSKKRAFPYKCPSATTSSLTSAHSRTPMKTPSRATTTTTSKLTTPFQFGKHESTSATTTSSSTRKTNLNSTTPRPAKPSVIAAVVEGRGCARGEIGLATIDLKNPQIILSQFSDSQTYIKTVTKLKIVQPLEILMPNTACENGHPSQLFKQLGDFFSMANVVTVQRRYFNESRGLQYVKQLRIPECKAVEMEIATKYYCLASVAALLKYVEFIQNVFYAPNSLKVVFKGSENTVMIDVQTASILELVLNLKDPKSEHTLYGVLHHTKTVGGSRLLRANILQPPCDLQTINERLECVTELLQEQEMFFNLKTILRRFLDIDHLLSLCIQIPKQETVKTADSKINYVICLKHTLELIAPLRSILENCQCNLLLAYRQTLDDPRYPLILTKIGEIVNDEAKYQKGTLQMRAQKCFAVKPNINGLLDVARRSYAEIVDDIARMIATLGQEYNLPLRTSFHAARGFFVQLYCGGKNAIGLDDLPPIFIQKTKVKNNIRMTTEELVKFNGRVDEALNEIYLMSNVVISQLLNDIVPDIGCLYRLTELVSTLDMLLAFAHTCTFSDYVRPEFTDTLAIKAGRHPVLEKLSPEPPVPNNVYLADGNNFAIITGPNMSGKSTYLKQVALLQVLAQIGCFVPAEYASFRLVHHIFSRKGSGDDIETNSSTFMMEMKEMNYILRTATDASLVIIDELGRGTGVEEGIGICYAICEELLKMKAFTLFTTHFKELTSLDGIYPNVCNYHFKVQHITGGPDGATPPRYIFTHTIEQGPTTELNYGIALAELSALPRSIVEDAGCIADSVRRQFQENNEQGEEAAKARATFSLAKRLLQVAKNSNVDWDVLIPYLSSLKEDYLRQMASLELE